MQNLTPALIEALQNQLTLERYANAAYSAFSAKCAADSFDGFAVWHAREASHELEHAAKVREFMIDRNVTPIYAPLDGAEIPGNYLTTFTAAQALEAKVTEALNALYFIADEAEDPQVCRLASDMLIEQRASERELFDIVTRLNFTAGDPSGVLMLDHEMGEGEA